MRTDWIGRIRTTVEPVPDDIYGPRYRCSVVLSDGTELPCVVLHSKSRLVELAKRRIREEMDGKGVFQMPDPFGEIVSTFTAYGNRINESDVQDATHSKYAIPLPLLNKIHGETSMGWTGWVFEMSDGELFSYGSSYHMDFFDLPDGYTFNDVKEVHNHSAVSHSGKLLSLRRGVMMTEGYDPNSVLRERLHFDCAVDGL